MNIYNFFQSSREKYPGSTALWVNNRDYTYKQLDSFINKISALVFSQAGSEKFIGLLAHRSLDAYAGLLSILKTGKGYVPLSPRYPKERNQRILQAAGLNTLIIGKECVHLVEEVLSGIDKGLVIYLPGVDAGEIPFSSAFLKKNVIFTKNDIERNEDFIDAVEVDDGSYAYMLFTSGSTGIPKGVPISHGNVSSYIEYTSKRYETSTIDRFSQTFDLTFDLSVHDMFICWAAGASLYCLPDSSLMAPAKFIKEKKLTMWFSVPSTAHYMSKFKMLKPNSFPSLRYSLFCGEPLSYELAAKWQYAAPHSIIENLYGPTEATIAISCYRLDKNNPRKNKSYRGIVSMGKIFDTQKSCIINENNELTRNGNEGELCLGGTQVTDGYWNDQERTQKQFIRIPGMNDQLWYKTGDLVKKDENGDLYYLSRLDFQVKVRGHRVELEEINLCIRRYTGANFVFSIVYPIENGIGENIYTFVDAISGIPGSEPGIISYCLEKIPGYMVPKEIIYLEKFPLNPNGKIDRNGLLEILKNRLNKPG